jgi:hypothetical protein
MIAGVTVLVAVMASLGSLALADTVSFPDVPAGHPYYAAVSDLASRGVINGYPNGSFGPGNPVTRQQFAKMIVLTGNYAVSEADLCPFDDVERSGPSSLYPDNYVAVCAAHQITKGKTPTTFDPTGNITRYQAISMVVRAADDLHPGLLVYPSAGFVASNGWGTDPTHGANVTRAEYNSLLAGLDTTVSPTGFMTRGEIAQMLHNLLGMLTPTTTTTAGSTTTTTGTSTTTTGSTTTTSSTTTTTTAVTSTTSSSTTSSSTTSSSTTTTTAVSLDGWESLHFVTTGSPSIAHWPGGELDAFARGADGALWYTYRGTAGWADWLSAGGSLAPGSGPASVVRADGLDVFVRGFDNALWYRRYSAGSWTTWQSLGGALSSDPAVASCTDDRMDVFIRGPFGHLWHIAYVGGTWFEWQDLGGSLWEDAGLGATAWDAQNYDVFVRGTDSALWHKWHSTGGWSDWENLGGVLTSGPGACGLPGYMLALVRAVDGTLWSREYSGGWGAWMSYFGGTAFVGDPDAVAYGANTDIVVRGLDDNVWHRSVDSTGVHP